VPAARTVERRGVTSAYSVDVDGMRAGALFEKLADQMRTVAKLEPDVKRRNELLDLARQYDRLAEKLAKEVRR